jgi:hypothetical protein
VEPSNGLTDARHHIYWADEGEYTGHPVDDFESDRREWVPLKLVPDMVARGEVPAANMAAALLLLHHLKRGEDTAPRRGAGNGATSHNALADNNDPHPPSRPRTAPPVTVRQNRAR